MSDPRPAGSVGGALWVRARQLLATHRGERALTGEEWLEVAREAHAFALSTFPVERRGRALRGFVEHHCAGQAPRTIAVYALALRLFGEQRSREQFGQFGACLEAAAIACGTTEEELPMPIVDRPETPKPATNEDKPEPSARQDSMLKRRRKPSIALEHWN